MIPFDSRVKAVERGRVPFGGMKSWDRKRSRRKVTRGWVNGMTCMLDLVVSGPWMENNLPGEDLRPSKSCRIEPSIGQCHQVNIRKSACLTMVNLTCIWRPHCRCPYLTWKTEGT